MKISDMFEGVRRLYFDTAPLIYFIEEHPTYFERMSVIIARMKTDSLEGICSVITLVEVLPVPLRAGRKDLVREYRDILLNSSELTCVALTSHMADLAADLRARYTLRTPDALHVATAIATGCDVLLTNDLNFRRLTEIAVVILDDVEIDPLPSERSTR